MVNVKRVDNNGAADVQIELCFHWKVTTEPFDLERDERLMNPLNHGE